MEHFWGAAKTEEMPRRATPSGKMDRNMLEDVDKRAGLARRVCSSPLAVLAAVVMLV